MPLTEKGETIKRNMEEHYGVKKGENVFYASKNKGKITGIDADIKRDDHGRFAEVAAAHGYKPTPSTGPNTYHHEAGHGLKVGYTATTRTGKPKGDVVAVHSERQPRDKDAPESEPNRFTKRTFTTPEQLNMHLKKTHGTRDSARQRYAAFRDAMSKGMSLDKALAFAEPRDEAGKFTGHAMGKSGNTLHTTSGHVKGYGGGPDIEQPIEGAKAVYETTKGAAHAVVGDEGAGIDVVSGGGEVGSDPKPPAMPKQEGITTPEATEPAVPATKDAKRRFRAAVIDAVRANVPLPKLIELGVISGVSGLKKQTPDYPITSDSFRRSFKAVVAKGFSTTDALWLVLRR